jgi:hypothetical protein
METICACGSLLRRAPNPSFGTFGLVNGLGPGQRHTERSAPRSLGSEYDRLGCNREAQAQRARFLPSWWA